jgi:hypothetical protein
MVNQRRSATEAVIFLIVMTSGCSGLSDDVQQFQSALDPSPQLLIVPAYYADSSHESDFQRIATSSAAHVIVNAGCDYTGIAFCDIGGGPASSNNTYLESKINYLHQHGKRVFGYVWTGGVPPNNPSEYRDTYAIYADIDRWQEYANGQLDGIFLDGASRSETSQGGVAQAESLADYVSNSFDYNSYFGGNSGLGRAIFNWGNIPSMPSYMMPYLECTLERPLHVSYWHTYVVREDSAAAFTGSFPVWAQDRYDQGHFAVIIHNSNALGTDVSNILTTAANWNSANVFVTDASDYSRMPNSNVWDVEVDEWGGQSFPYGAAPGGYFPIRDSGQCPAPSSGTPTFP